jgi:hypothetical protein
MNGGVSKCKSYIMFVLIQYVDVNIQVIHHVWTSRCLRKHHHYIYCTDMLSRHELALYHHIGFNSRTDILICIYVLVMLSS